MDESMRLPDGATPFHSGDLEPEETFEYTFETPGRYRYFCVPHEAAMRATVIVEPAGGQ
jgi:plastocyanin